MPKGCKSRCLSVGQHRSSLAQHSICDFLVLSTTSFTLYKRDGTLTVVRRFNSDGILYHVAFEFNGGLFISGQQGVFVGDGIG